MVEMSGSDGPLNDWTLTWNQMVHMWHVVYGPRLTVKIPNAKLSMFHGECDSVGLAH